MTIYGQEFLVTLRARGEASLTFAKTIISAEPLVFQESLANNNKGEIYEGIHEVHWTLSADRSRKSLVLICPNVLPSIHYPLFKAYFITS